MPVLLAAIVLHNLEEAIAIAVAPETFRTAIMATGLGLPIPPVGALYAGLGIFTIVPALVLLRSTRKPSPTGLFLCCMMAAMVLANAIVPHLALTVLTGGYTPGALTAAILCLPVASCTLLAASRNGWIARPAIAGAICLGAVLLPMVLFGFWALQQLIAEVAA